VGGTNQNWHHYGAAWDGLRFVVKTSNPTNSIRVSYDGITWINSAGTGFTVAGYGVAWNGSLWIVSSTGATYATSPDGIEWTTRSGALNIIASKHARNEKDLYPSARLFKVNSTNH
jgi:hypothetical protein